MLDDILNSNTSEEVVHPPNENSNTSEEVVHPQDGVITPDDIDHMTSEEFARYMAEADYTPDAADNNAEDTYNNSADEEESTPEPEAEETGKADDTPPAPFKTFSTEEEYESEVGKRINASIRQRMRKHNEQAAKYSRLEEMAKEYYPQAQDSLSELTADLESQAAERADIPVEEYRKRIDDARDAQLYRSQMQRERDAKTEQDNIINGWQRDAKEIKYINPEFDLREAIKNPAFAKMLREGKSVFEAYATVHKPQPPKAPERKPVIQNVANPGGGTGGRQTSNPAGLSAEDFKKYIEECRNGRR